MPLRECVLFLQNVFSFYTRSARRPETRPVRTYASKRMCSVSTECVLILQNVGLTRPVRTYRMFTYVYIFQSLTIGYLHVYLYLYLYLSPVSNESMFTYACIF